MESSKAENKPYLFPLVLGLFLLALFLRLVKADSIPFTRADADLAWQALEISKFRAESTSPLALYTGLTGLLFWFTSSNNFFARFFPALFGSSLIFIPYILMSSRSAKLSLGLSLLLVLDPVLVIFSRQVAGPILAISTLAWSFVFLYQHKNIAAGIAFGMAILAGKYFWLTTALIGLYLLISFLVNRQGFSHIIALFHKPSKSFYFSTLISSLLVATSFLINPGGLTGIASGLVDLFSINYSSSFPLVLPVFFLLTYSLYLLLPFSLLLAHSSSRSRLMNLGFLITLIALTALFQNRLSGIYLLIELFIIIVIAKSAMALRLELHSPALVSLVAFVFFSVILSFTLLSFNQFSARILGEMNLITDLLPILLALLLIFISYLLIGLGWGFDHTKPALQAAIILITVFFSLGLSLSQTWNDATVSQLLFSNSEILFPDKPFRNELGVFIQNKVLNTSTASYKLDKMASPGENWEFEEFSDSSVVSSMPAFIINDSTSESGMMSAYRGTSIVFARRLNLSNKAYSELIHLISSKTLPVSDITRTLWVQTALFPGGK